MDLDLLKQSLNLHGESLFRRLRCEQKENPNFQLVVQDLDKHKSGAGSGNPLVEQFVARKADILFSPSWKTAAPKDEDVCDDAATEAFAVVPPLDWFIHVSYEERRSMLFRDLERGDVLVGRINNIREYGFFLTLLCTAGGLKRTIEDLELTALCHIREIPSSSSHDDPLSYYQTGDLIRAAVKDIDRFQEKITVSLLQSSLTRRSNSPELGVITREELLTHSSFSEDLDSRDTYEGLLKCCHGYHNPSVVNYLLHQMGVSDSCPPSLMRGLQSELFREEDFAVAIRKKQSMSWALKCVRAGVEHFKHGRHVDAMNEYNKALEIDENNIEALVARGALYANKGSLLKSISDFELALKLCPDHRNAGKYLSQTLVERGKRLEEQEQLVTAESLYRKASELDESNSEAKSALSKITDTIKKSIQTREEAKEQKEEKEASSSRSSAQKLRKLLKEEKRLKKRRKRSSSSSASSSSSSSSSSHRRAKKKKKKKKRRKSERENRRKSSKGETDEEDEWCPAPVNTTATFLQQEGFARSQEGRGGAGGFHQLLSAATNSSELVEKSHQANRRRSSDVSEGKSGDRGLQRRSSETQPGHRSTADGVSGSGPRPEPDSTSRLQSRDGLGNGATSAGPHKKLPADLAQIFDQIAKFEKSKKGSG